MTLLILQYGPQLSVAILACLLVPWALRLCSTPHAELRAEPRANDSVARRPLPSWVLAGVCVMLAAALAWAPGPWAAALALPYLALCFYAACQALYRLATRACTPLAEFALDWSHLHLAGAAVWTFCFCAGYPLLGYPLVWVALTAAHFHAAGFIVPVLAGGLARRRQGRVHPGLLVAPILGMPLTAIGIYTARPVELLAGFTIVFATLWLAVEFLRETRRSGQVLFALSGICAAVSMPLAGLHLLRRYDLLPFAHRLDPVSSMVVTHGLLNTLGFAGLGLWAIARQNAAPLDAPPGRPHSRLAAQGLVGADFFARTHMQTAGSAHGLVDALEDLHAGAGVLAPSIRAFYERTDAHLLRVRPSWRFAWTGRIWRRLGQRMQQLQLPVDSHATTDEHIASRIFALDSARDGRSHVRAWVRTRADGAAMYVAAYSTHRLGAQPYMNISFPLPFGNLASLLRLDITADDGSSMVLTTRARRGCCDAGIFLVLFGGRLPLRLPMDETIRVWDVGAGDLPADLVSWAGVGATAVARHDVVFLGVHWFTLDYAMQPDGRA